MGACFKLIPAILATVLFAAAHGEPRARDAAGPKLETVLDAATGVKLGIPVGLVTQALKPNQWGNNWISADKRLNIDTLNFGNERNLRSWYDDLMKRNSDNARRTRSPMPTGTIDDKYFKLEGAHGDSRFYVEAHMANGEVRGISIFYPSGRPREAAAARAVIKSFQPFPLGVLQTVEKDVETEQALEAERRETERRVEAEKRLQAERLEATKRIEAEKKLETEKRLAVERRLEHETKIEADKRAAAERLREVERQAKDLQRLESEQRVAALTQQLAARDRSIQALNAKLLALEGRHVSSTQVEQAIRKERDQLRLDRDALIVDRDELRQGRDDLVAERNQLRKQRDDLQSERDGERKRVGDLVAEQKRLRAWFDEEVTDLVSQRDDIEKERDHLRHQRSALQDRVAELTKQIADLQKGPARHALIIGVNNYPKLPAEQQLKTAISDANAIGDVFFQLGFSVTRYFDLDRKEMHRRVHEFAEKIKGDDEVVFFFAGHGVSVSGVNFLLPADIERVGPNEEALVRNRSISETDIMTIIQGKKPRVALFVLDACRDNPFAMPGARSVVGGIARGLSSPQVNARGIFTVYSAGIGERALDNLGSDDRDPHSVFTRVFAPALMRTDVHLNEILLDVRADVAALARTLKHDQTPAIYNQAGKVWLGNNGSTAPPVGGPYVPTSVRKAKQ